MNFTDLQILIHNTFMYDANLPGVYISLWLPCYTFVNCCRYIQLNTVFFILKCNVLKPFTSEVFTRYICCVYFIIKVIFIFNMYCNKVFRDLQVISLIMSHWIRWKQNVIHVPACMLIFKKKVWFSLCLSYIE